MLSFGLLAAFVMWLWLARRVWFFGDDWEFLLNRGTVPGPSLGLLEPHNEHWSTIPILIYRTLFAVFGLQSYLPYMVPVLVAHIAVCALLYALLRRAGVQAWVSVGAALLMAFLGSGAENTTWAFQVGFVGSMAFGLLALLLESTLPPAWRTTGFVWGSLVLGLMCSGVGVAMVGLVVVHSWIRSEWRRAALVVAVPAVVYLLWFLGWGRHAVRSQTSSAGAYLKVPEYVWTGLSGAWEKNVGMAGSGPVVVVGLLLACALAGRREARVLAIAGLVGAMVQLGLSGVTRLSFGVDQAASSRYAYLITAFTLPAAALAVDWVLRRAGWPRPTVFAIAGGVLILLLVNGVREGVEFANVRAANIGDLRQRLAAALMLQRQGQQLLLQAPAPVFNPDIDLPRLAAVADRLPTIEPDPAAVLAARAALEVAVATQGLGLPPATAPVPLTGFVPPSANAGCGTYAGGTTVEGVRLDPTGGPRQITVTGDGTQIRTRLVDGANDSPWSDWPTSPGQAYTIGTTAGNLALEVSLGVTGPTTICLP